MIVKPYPKDNEARAFGVREQWLDAIAEHISSRGIGRDELLFATEAGTPISPDAAAACPVVGYSRVCVRLEALIVREATSDGNGAFWDNRI
jgi:hypothetical protein